MQTPQQQPEEQRRPTLLEEAMRKCLPGSYFVLHQPREYIMQVLRGRIKRPYQEPGQQPQTERSVRGIIEQPTGLLVDVVSTGVEKEETYRGVCVDNYA